MLKRELFLHIDELRYVAYRWRMDYNHYRPHSSLNYMAPAALAATAGKNPSGPQLVKLSPCCPNLPGCPNDFLPENIGKNSHSDWY
ncbi:integrase core domain-containing protein [Planctomycetota bacterium]